MKNDGWTDLYYDLCDDTDINERLSKLINESCHVFRAHADGTWETVYKPKYTKMYAAEIKACPFLVGPLLSLRDRVVSNLTHAAMDLNKNDG